MTLSPLIRVRFRKLWCLILRQSKEGTGKFEVWPAGKFAAHKQLGRALRRNTPEVRFR